MSEAIRLFLHDLPGIWKAKYDNLAFDLYGKSKRR